MKKVKNSQNRAFSPEESEEKNEDLKQNLKTFRINYKGQYVTIKAESFEEAQKILLNNN